MDRWLLKIELNGEWEECSFKTQSEALTTFLAVFKDYAALVRRAILFSPGRNDGWVAWHKLRGSSLPN